jgi:hypothetical protein
MKKIDINIVYNQLIEKLKTSEYSDEIPHIQNLLTGATTGNEALASQAHYLVTLRSSNFPAFKLVEKEINEYLEYCRQCGSCYHEILIAAL